MLSKLLKEWATSPTILSTMSLRAVLEPALILLFGKVLSRLPPMMYVFDPRLQDKVLKVSSCLAPRWSIQPIIWFSIAGT